MMREIQALRRAALVAILLMMTVTTDGGPVICPSCHGVGRVPADSRWAR